MGMPEVDAGEQHVQLLRCDFPHLLFRIRPGEAMFFKAFLDQAKPGGIPKERFQYAPLAIAEEEHRAVFKQVLLQFLFHQDRKAVD